MWQVKKWKLNTRPRFNGGKKKEVLKYARPLTPVMCLERWGKARRQNRCRQVEYFQNTPSIDLYGKA
jgi:hypothetical protein